MQSKPSKEATRLLETIKTKGFARVANEIEQRWGTFLGSMYLRDLILVEPDMERQGFPLDVLTCILQLDELHQVCYLLNNEHTDTIWNTRRDTV